MWGSLGSGFNNFVQSVQAGDLNALNEQLVTATTAVTNTVTAKINEQKAYFKAEEEKLQKMKEEKDQASKKVGFTLWTVYAEENVILEEELKTRVLALSQDPESFTNPPADEDFEFRIEDWTPFALEAFKHDQELDKRRYELVPKKVQEDIFWKSYFYQVCELRKEMKVQPLVQTRQIHMVQQRLEENISVLDDNLSKDLADALEDIEDAGVDLDEFVKIDESDIVGAPSTTVLKSHPGQTFESGNNADVYSMSTAGLTSSTSDYELQQKMDELKVDDIEGFEFPEDDLDIDHIESMLADVDDTFDISDDDALAHLESEIGDITNVEL